MIHPQCLLCKRGRAACTWAGCASTRSGTLFLQLWSGGTTPGAACVQSGLSPRHSDASGISTCSSLFSWTLPCCSLRQRAVCRTTSPTGSRRSTTRRTLHQTTRYFWQSQARRSWVSRSWCVAVSRLTCSCWVRSRLSWGCRPRPAADSPVWSHGAPHCCCAANSPHWSTFGTTSVPCLPPVALYVRSRPTSHRLLHVPSPWTGLRYFRLLLKVLWCVDY